MFVVDANDPETAVSQCRNHLALLSDLLDARQRGGIDFTDDGIAGLSSGLHAASTALAEIGGILSEHVHVAWALGRRMHRLGLLTTERATSAELGAVVNRLLDQHEAEAREAAFNARIEQVAARIGPFLRPKARAGRAVRKGT